MLMSWIFLETFYQAMFELSYFSYQNPIETKDYSTLAERPHFSLLNKAHI